MRNDPGQPAGSRILPVFLGEAPLLPQKNYWWPSSAALSQGRQASAMRFSVSGFRFSVKTKIKVKGPLPEAGTENFPKSYLPQD